ncbi:MAG: twin-arginine translocase TatA/TatE family subunit [Proteobacteria bacterium]|nr:twin-arginine translocase TatA/TatE family subunit [Pseudomonadota bacterium]
MFGLGVPEIFAILVIATVILGPEHMPKAARMIGRWSAKIRSAATSFNEAISNDKDLNEIRTEIGEVRSELLSARHELTQAGREVSEVTGRAHAAFREAQAELKNFQAVSGRPAEVEAAREVSDAPEASLSEPGAVQESSVTDYMSRPMGRLGVTSERGDERAEGAVRLSRPVLLPGPVARLVTRQSVSLDMPSEDARGGNAVALEEPDVRRACLWVRRLDMPRVSVMKGVTLTRVRLDHV